MEVRKGGRVCGRRRFGGRGHRRATLELRRQTKSGRAPWLGSSGAQEVQ